MTSVVATAGHVDHGKSTLVRALTGMEPDRLDEEHRRGLSIELGYAWTTWPGPGDVAFVDVPGHRRFLRTTLAGLGPVPVVVLVVAADDGWKPQGAEHLAALDALGVRHGVLVISKADRADPASSLIEARQALAATSLAGLPDVAVSATHGTGIDHLVRVLGQELARVPAPDPAAPVRLWVDRSFTVPGAGQVLTGTLPAGTISVGAELSTATGARVRVRGLESLGRPVETARGTARVALNVRVRGRVERGQAVFDPGTHVVTTVLDASVRGTGAAVGAAAVLHIGSAAVGCRVRPLGERHVRLTLAEPLPLHVGDRALVRDPGRPGSLLALTVLDVRPPVLTGRGAATRRGAELAGLGTPAEVAAHLLASRPQPASDLIAMGLPIDHGVEVAPGWLAAPDRWRNLGSELVSVVRLHAGPDPVNRPLSVAAATARLDLPDQALVAPLAATVGLHVRHGVVEAEAGTTLPAGVAEALDHLTTWLDAHPFAAPTADHLGELGLDDRALTSAGRAGRLLRLGPRIVLAAASDATACERLAGLPGPFRVTDVCAALGTTRRTAVPLLELLDRTGRTRRLPDGRRALRPPHRTLRDRSGGRPWCPT